MATNANERNHEIAAYGRTIDAVIVTYNSERDILACISSLQRCTEVGRIIVVDNCSRDATVTLVKSTGVSVIPMPRNAGFAAAANRGASASESRFVAFINPDAAAEMDTFSMLLAVLGGDPQTWAVGPALVNAAGLLEYSARAFPSVWSGLLNRRWLDWFPRWHPPEVRRFLMSDHSRESTFECDWLSGAVLLVRRDVFMSVGGFDPRFFMYYEDVDLCKRVAERGYKCKYVGEARATHRIGGSSRQLSLRAGLWRVQSLIRYKSRHLSGRLVPSLIFWMATIAGIALELASSVGREMASVKS